MVIYKEDGTFLAMRRSADSPSKPSGWDLPGGKIDNDEDPVDAIIREAKEETQLDIRDPKILTAVSAAHQKDFWIIIGYAVQAPNKDPVISFEHDDQRWVTPEEFEELGTFLTDKKIIRAFALLK